MVKKMKKKIKYNEQETKDNIINNGINIVKKELEREELLETVRLQVKEA